jgi:hypothetical protein
MGKCNLQAQCCPQCGPNKCCGRNNAPQRLTISFVAGTDAGHADIIAAWIPSLGMWIADWQSSCGAKLRICITCGPGPIFGINPPSLTCPDRCNEPCCGQTVSGGTGEPTCFPIFALYVMVIPNRNECCPVPCAGGSTWTVIITETP